MEFMLTCAILMTHNDNKYRHGTGFGTVQNSLFQQLFENFAEQLDVLMPITGQEDSRAAGRRRLFSTVSRRDSEPILGLNRVSTSGGKETSRLPEAILADEGGPFGRTCSDLESAAAQAVAEMEAEDEALKQCITGHVKNN